MGCTRVGAGVLTESDVADAVTVGREPLEHDEEGTGREAGVTRDCRGSQKECRGVESTVPI